MARVQSAAKWAERVEWLKAHNMRPVLIERAQKAYERRRAEEAWIEVRHREASQKRLEKLRARAAAKARRENIYVSIRTNDIPAPPCVRFACPHITDCGSRFMACESFSLYASEGRLIPPDLLDGPTVERYAALYSEVDHESVA